MVSTAAAVTMPSMRRMPSMPAMPAMPPVSVEIAIGTTACGWGGKWVGTCRRKWVLVVPVGFRVSEGYQLVGCRLWAALEGIVPWIRHYARSISIRWGLMGNVGPLSTWVVRRLTRPGRIARPVVVAVQTVRVIGLGPSPTRPGPGVQRVSASRSVARWGVVDGWMVRSFAARLLRSVAGSGRWRGHTVMLDSRGAGCRVRGLDLVNVVPVFLVFVFVGVFVLLAAGRDLHAVLFVGVNEVFRTSRMIDGDVSPKRNVDVSCAWTTHCRRYRNTGGSGGTRDTGRGRRSSTADRTARKRPLGRGSATMRKGYD